MTVGEGTVTSCSQIHLESHVRLLKINWFIRSVSHLESSITRDYPYKSGCDRKCRKPGLKLIFEVYWEF